MTPNPLAPYIKSAEWHSSRLGTLRASDATCIAKGDMPRIRKLWKVKTGKELPDDSDPSLPALIGQALEDLNRRYYWRTTGREVWGDQTKLVHPDHDWLAASLDGITTTSDGREAPFEAKAVGALKDMWRHYEQHQHEFKYLIKSRLWEERVLLPEEIQNYAAQCHVAMACGGWDVAVLCTIIGNSKQFVHELPWDAWYWCELFDRLQAFWQCVQDGRMPDAETFGRKVE